MSVASRFYKQAFYDYIWFVVLRKQLRTNQPDYIGQCIISIIVKRVTKSDLVNMTKILIVWDWKNKNINYN